MQLVPDWVDPKKGDPELMKPPHWVLDLIRSFLSPDYHQGCGGHFEDVGTSGLLVVRMYQRCNRCGAQRNFRLEN
jgi:hypothetical protein